ncbi:DUF3558 domain-containing protein [Actinophytocola gossypii]|uniref:DUF3558 domain-containing protein n=1 Tax=Actinophytocola gossypii TaxID=2812003 RepID=A0ABT2JIW6_9PSEU|nr:DUF3558 domain-containing protein [Actinophytocola gossypii]MCT2587827.1 DUF3558 domain-containing protein [Actinophytocola gossypii]
MTGVTRFACGVVVLLFAAIAAGCTSTSAGAPKPAVTAAESTGDEPTRPREIRLDDVDPCTLLPEAEYEDYYLDEPGKPEESDRGEDQCVWYGDAGYMGVSLVTYDGVDARKGRYGQMEPTDPVEGFPAYTITLPGDEDNACFVLVDTADGQYLDVQVGLYDTSRDVPAPCEYAHQFASSVMSTLLTS